jgi:aromatic-L-amino-acid/L-tryptophan decarboxylase
MDRDAFVAAAHKAVHWIASYWDRLEELPVRSQVKPGEVARALPEHPPEQPDGIDAWLDDLGTVVEPGLTHWQSPNFFAYYPSNASGPSVLGDLLSSALGVQGMIWATSPAATEVETRVADWVLEALDLPRAFHSAGAGGGVIQDTASSAALCAMVAAREVATGGKARSEGVRSELVAYTSAEAHSSIEKAAMIAGVGSNNVRKITCDAALAMRPEALAAAIEEDLAAGKVPFFVAATVGTTSTGAVDPLPAIAAITRQHTLWLHVDGAMMGSAAVCPEHREMHAGVEHADSYVFNPHKWLLVGFDCSLFYVRDRSALTGALSINPEYLRNAASSSGAVIDYRDWQVPLGRRFRALKLWFVLRHYGLDGLRTHIRSGVALTAWLVEQIEADDRFELMAPPRLNLVCFRKKVTDQENEALLESINASGRAYLSHTAVRGQYTMRMCVGTERTEHRHVAQAWAQLSAP